MAISGCLLLFFVVGHLLGNLQVYAGDGGEAINAYSHFLQSNPGIVWSARIGLVLLVVLHVWSAVALAAANRAARPIAYAGNPTPPAASYASRTMLMSGIIVAAFIIYHLLHFTVQSKAVNFTGQDFVKLHDAKGRHDVYRMLITGFSHPLVSAVYIVSMSLLCLHLSHGVAAMFQSIGVTSGHCRPILDSLARASAWVIFIGYISIPIAVLLGLVN